MGAEAIRDAGANATEYAPPPPRPLFRKMPDPDPFPLDVLGDVLGPAAEAIHDIIQAPYPVCAQSVLAAATLAAQGLVNVKLPHGSERPLSEYFLSVLESGERKTAADELACKAIALRESELAAAQKHVVSEYEALTDIFDAEWKRITGDRTLDRSAKQKKLADLGSKPKPPAFPMLTCPEPTYEGLFRLLQHGPHSVGVFSSEGGQLIGGHALNDDNRLKTAAGLSEGWDGKPWKRVRSGDGLIILPNRRVTLNLMVQPMVANRLLADPLLRDQGLLSRILVAAPLPTSGTRFWKEPQPHSRQALHSYSQRLLNILRRPPLKDDDEFPVMLLTPTARELWIGFADSIEKQLGSEGALNRVRGFANKAAEHAARIAGVLEIISNPDRREINTVALAAAIEAVEFYLSEAVRLYESAQTNVDVQKAARLLYWLHNSWTESLISLVEIYQRGPRDFRDKKDASEAVSILADHLWLVHLEGVHEVAGVRRRDVWRIVRDSDGDV